MVVLRSAIPQTGWGTGCGIPLYTNNKSELILQQFVLGLSSYYWMVS